MKGASLLTPNSAANAERFLFTAQLLLKGSSFQINDERGKRTFQIDAGSKQVIYSVRAS